MTAAEWATVAAGIVAVVGLAVACLRFAVRTGVLLEEVREMRSDLARNVGHTETIANSWGMMTMRIATMEVHLQRTSEYHPPVMTSGAPGRRWDDVT